MKKPETLLFVVVSCIPFLIGFVSRSAADTGYFDQFCRKCHGSNVSNTCSGCHEMLKSITARTDKAYYRPGEKMSIGVTQDSQGTYGGGWARLILYNGNGDEIGRVTGPNGMGWSGEPTFHYPDYIMYFSTTAPTKPGTYAWPVAWYGHVPPLLRKNNGSNDSRKSVASFDRNRDLPWEPDPDNPGHARLIVSTNPFVVR